MGITHFDAIALAEGKLYAGKKGEEVLVLQATPRLECISKECAITGFTDGGGTSGYIDFAANSLPAGAIPLGWKAVVTEGFDGNSSATISVGVSGDTDRFSADTAQSVAAAGVVGSSALAADACDGIGAAQTPRVTVTTASDFTAAKSDGDGVMTVYLYYLRTA